MYNHFSLTDNNKIDKIISKIVETHNNKILCKILENEIIIKIQAPGFDKSLIDIEFISHNVLCVKSKQENEFNQKLNTNIFLTDYITKPCNLIVKNTEAKCENGIIIITIPFTENKSTFKINLK